MNRHEFNILEEYKGQRLDVFLKTKFPDKSRSYFQNIIDDENVLVNNIVKKSNYKLKKNDSIIVTIPEPVELSIDAEDIPINIVYEDEDVVIVNKSQGMVVHPAPGNYNGTLVNALMFHCKDLSSINGVIRPGIVHRIDKDTSGLLIVAKNDNAHISLAEQFKEHSITRTYYALVEGVVKSDSGIIEKNLGRNPKDRLKMAIVENGKEAITHYTVLERFNKNTLVKCNLETGRTHQIRVHMGSIGHPLVGDPVYGYKKQRFKLEGQMLHAKTLGFIHPSKDKYMEFDSDIPDYYAKVLNTLRNESK